MKKKILGFAGSNSAHSINKQLVAFVLEYFKDYDSTLLDLNDFEMPLYSKEREAQAFPKEVQHFIEKIADHDAIVCSMAENNQNFSVAMKNVLDWCSRAQLDFFQQKPMLLLSTSPGGYGGGNVMKLAEPLFHKKFSAQVLDTFSLPSFHQNFENKKIHNAELLTALETKIQDFKTQL